MNDAAVLSHNILFRPYWRFEYWYDRVAPGAPLPGSVPIPLIGRANPEIPAATAPPGEDDWAFDPAVRAADPLYSDNLIAMTPMPALGSTALTYVPAIPSLGDREETFYYAFLPVWRMRTTADWRKYERKANMWRESPGAPDSRPATPEDRVILPAATGGVIYTAPSPTYNTGVIDLPGNLAMSPVTPEAFGGLSGPYALGQAPYGPDGQRLEHQQGIADPAGGSHWYKPFHRPHWMKTCGNELGWLVFKVEAPEAGQTELVYRDWDFDYNPATGYCGTVGPPEDIGFSVMFGVGGDPAVLDGRYAGFHPESGLWVFAGQAPL